jgi:hypothetical protein
MKKTLGILAITVALACTAPAQSQDLFGPGEFNILGYGMYIDRETGDEDWRGGVELNYFMTRNVGFGITTHWEDFKGSFFDNVAGDLYFRFPLERLPVAPYLVGTGGWEFETDRWFGGGGGGLDWRFSKAVGIFGDVQWLFYEYGHDGIAVRAGLRIGGGR